MTASRGNGFEPNARLAAGNSVTQTAAQRSRELGYADAMHDIWQIARDLEKLPLSPPEHVGSYLPEVAFHVGVVLADQQLHMLADYAFDAYLLHLEPGKGTTRRVDHMARYPAFYGTARPEKGTR